MAALALISEDTTLYAELLGALAQSEWSVDRIDAGALDDRNPGYDVVAIEARDAEREDSWPNTRLPLLLIQTGANRTEKADEYADDIIFRGAASAEWLTRLDRLRARTPLEYLRTPVAEAFASMAPGVMVVGPDHRLVFANPRAYEILGHREETLPEGDFEALISEHDRPRMQIALHNHEYPHGTDVRMIRREGREIVCRASLAPLLGAEDHTVISIEDVTNTRRTEQELFEAMKFLESLIDASVDAIVATDMEQRVVLLNPSAERITGRYLADGTSDLTLADLLGRGSAELVMQRLMVEDHGGESRLEPTLLELVDTNRQTVPIQLSASLVEEDGSPSAIVLIFTDLRERVRVEERVAQAQKKLAFSEKQGVLAELAGTAAHELNQPLTSMMAYAELLLRQSEPGSPGAKAAKVLIREAERMAEIVRKIGKITKYETTAYVGHQKIFDLDRAADPSPSGRGGKR